MRHNPLSTYETFTGFILDWHITGFFPNGTDCDHDPDLYEPKRSRHWKHDYLAPWGGATNIQDLPKPKGNCPVEWMFIRGEPAAPKIFLQSFLRSCPDLARAFPGEAQWDHQWYALALLQSDRPQDAELRLCGNDGCQAWWNGQLVLEEHSWHKLAYDLNIVPVALRKGRNALLLKLDRFGLLARLTAPGGARIKDNVCSLGGATPKAKPPGTFEQLTRYARTLKVTQPLRATTPAQYRRWRHDALAHFHRCIGPFPRLPARPPKPALVERTACDGYTRFRYHLSREAGSIMPVYVLQPEARRFNGRSVICPHGHGQDDKVVAGIQPPAKPYNNWCGNFTGNYAELLAQAGFLTATWSERTLSHERQDLPGREDPCNIAGLCAGAMGMTLPGLNLFDLHGVADFVSKLKGVDPARMGVTGLSGGGTMTYLAGAYDDRFRAVAIFCGMFSYADYAVEGGCGQQVVPGLYPQLDVGELLCLVAPRPLLLAQGRRDVLFSMPLLHRYARQARAAYRLLDREDHVEVCIYDLAHQVNIQAAIDFFTRRL